MTKGQGPGKSKRRQSTVDQRVGFSRGEDGQRQELAEHTEMAGANTVVYEHIETRQPQFRSRFDLETFPHMTRFRPPLEDFTYTIRFGAGEQYEWRSLLDNFKDMKTNPDAAWDKLTDDQRLFIRFLFIGQVDFNMVRIEDVEDTNKHMKISFANLKELLEMFGSRVEGIEIQFFRLYGNHKISADNMQNLSNICHVLIPKHCQNFRILIASGDCCGRFPYGVSLGEKVEGSPGFPNITTLIISEGFGYARELTEMIDANEQIKLIHLCVNQSDFSTVYSLNHWRQLQWIKILTITEVTAHIVDLVNERELHKPIMSLFKSLEKVVLRDAVTKNIKGLCRFIDETIEKCPRPTPIEFCVDKSIVGDKPDFNGHQKTTHLLQTLHINMESYDNKYERILKYMSSITELFVHVSEGSAGRERFYRRFDWETCDGLRKVFDVTNKEIYTASYSSRDAA